MATLMDGVWMLPLRGRPEGAVALRKALWLTEPDARVVCCVDDADPDAVALRMIACSAGWHVCSMPGSPTTVEKLNHMVSEFPVEAFYGLLASDIIPQTIGWGTALAAAVPAMGLSFCDDSIHGKRLPTHPVVDGGLVRALGWWAYPEARHNGIDVYLRDLAYEFGGCVYLEEHLFLHNHPTAGRGAPDDVYARANSWQADDAKAAQRWALEGVHQAKARVRSLYEF